MSYKIINHSYLSNSKLNLFTDTIYNNFIDLSKYKHLSHDKKNIYELLKSDTAQVYLIIINNKIAAYSVGNITKLHDGRKVVYITYLFTAEQFRKHGFASKLLQMSFDVCKKKYLDGVMLTCDSQNITLYDFYLKKGFMPDLLLRTYDKYEVLFSTC